MRATPRRRLTSAPRRAPRRPSAAETRGRVRESPRRASRDRRRPPAAPPWPPPGGGSWKAWRYHAPMLESHPQGTMIVTGGSRGIGAATARLAAERGYAVCVNFVSNERAALEVVDEIRDRNGRAIAVRADVAVETEVIHLFDE